MQRFGNFKVRSIFGFLHPETAISIFSLKKKLVLKIELTVLVFGFGLEAKTGCLCLLLRSMTTSYYVVVGTDTLLHKK